MVASAQVENSQANPDASVYLLVNLHTLVAACRHYNIRSRRVVTGVGRIPCVNLVIPCRRNISLIPCRIADRLGRRESIVCAATLTAEAGSVPAGARGETAARFVVNDRLPCRALCDQLHVI